MDGTLAQMNLKHYLYALAVLWMVEKPQLCAGLIKSKNLKVKMHSESSNLYILFEGKNKTKLN